MEVRLPKEIIDNPELLKYPSYFNQFMETVKNWFKDKATSCHKWPRKEIGFKNYDDYKLDIAFYRKARNYFKFQVIQDNKGISRYLATFLKEAGYPEAVIPRNIIETIISKCHWEQLAENPREAIEELRCAGIIADKIKNNKYLFEKEEGIAALTDLLQKLAYMKLNYEVKDDHDLRQKYSVILQLEGIKGKPKRKLTAEYKLELDDALESKDCIPKNIGVFFNIVKEGAILPNGRISPINPEFASNAGNNDLDFSLMSKMEIKINQGLITSNQNHGIFIRMNKYTHDLNIYLLSGEKNNQDLTNIESLKRTGVLVFDSNGSELVGDSIDVGTNVHLWLLPLSLDTKCKLDCIPDVNKINISGSFRPFYQLHKNQTIDGLFQLNELTIRFTDIPVRIILPEKQAFATRFLRNVYTDSEAYNKRIKIDVDNEDTSIITKMEDIISGNVDEFNGRSVPLPSKPGNYRLSVYDSNGNKLKECKISIIPEIEIKENENSVSISCVGLEDYNVMLKAEKLEQVDSKEDELLYYPKESTNIDAVLTIQHKRSNLKFIDLPILIDCNPDVVAYYNSSLVEIKSDDYINFEDLYRSGYVKVKSKSFSDTTIENQYTLELIPTPLRHQFTHKYIYNISASFPWDPIMEIMEKIPMNQATVNIFKNNEHTPCFSFVIVNKNVCKLIFDYEKQKIYPDQNIPEVGKYSYRLFNICYLWEDPKESEDIELNCSDIEPGIWMVYLVHDAQIVSEGFFLKNKAEAINLSLLDDFQKSLLDLELNSYESFRKVYDGLYNSGYFIEHEKARRLVSIYENIIKKAVPDDFYIYALLPEKFPLLPLWSVLAVDPDDVNTRLGQESLFLNHNRFCWELMKLSYLDKVQDSPVFYLLDNPMFMGIGDNVWWIKIAWFIRKHQRDKEQMSLFINTLLTQEVYGYLDNFRDAYKHIGSEGDYISDFQSEFYPTSLSKGIIASIKETIDSFRGMHFDWINEADRVYFNADGAEKLVDKFIDNVNKYTDASPANKTHLAPLFLRIILRVKNNQFNGVSETNEEELYCAMLAYDAVCQQLELKERNLFERRTVRLIGIKAFKNSSPRHFKAWYTQWMILLIHESMGFDLLTPESFLDSIADEVTYKSILKVTINGVECEYGANINIFDLDLDFSQSNFEFFKEYERYQIRLSSKKEELRQIKIFEAKSRKMMIYPIANYLFDSNIGEWEMEIFDKYYPEQILFKCTLNIKGEKT